MLYDRDYRFLTEGEANALQQADDALHKAMNGSMIVPEEVRQKYNQDIPPAALYYKQLFPNNYINPNDLKNISGIKDVMEEFKLLLDIPATEREILNFIRDKKGYFIIASILKSQHYLFGHHKVFAFNEFQLPSTFVVDYLLVGKNSGGYEFVFVELESPSGRITTGNGEFGDTIRKGLKQVSDWDSWLEANYSSLKLVFDKYVGATLPLSREFFQLDKSRLHYVVIAGRRADFKPKTYELRRRHLQSNNTLVLHYDNLIDSVNFLLQKGNY